MWSLNCFPYLCGVGMHFLETYFRKYYQSLCLFSKSLVGDGSVSEDIVQDTFVKIISSEIQFESELHFRQYAYIAVKNTCYKYMAKSGRMSMVGIDELNAQPDESVGPGNIAIVRAETVRMIKDAVNALPTRYREVFCLAYIKNMKNEEIADKLGISVNTVKVMRQRAKAKLRETLKDLFPLLFIYLKYIDTI